MVGKFFHPDQPQHFIQLSLAIRLVMNAAKPQRNILCD
jgi:hypothetical protein